MDSFLSNRHPDIYKGKGITYRKYVVIDSSQKNKEYIEDDSDRLPKDIENLGFIDIFSGKYRINVTSPLMVCPFGFNRQSHTMSLQFTNLKTNSEMQSFYEFIQKVEFQQMRYLGLSEEETDLYLSQIRYDKKGKYDPTLIVKIPFNNQNRYDVEMKNKDSDCSISKIYNFSKLQCDIYIDKIWKFNGRYVCKWKASKVYIH
jgi:hypothetical protein